MVITAQLYSSTWFKLFIGIVSMAIGLAIFKLGFTFTGSPFLTPFLSFIALVAISIAIYALVFFVLHRIAPGKASGEEKIG